MESICRKTPIALLIVKILDLGCLFIEVCIVVWGYFQTYVISQTICFVKVQGNWNSENFVMFYSRKYPESQIRVEQDFKKESKHNQKRTDERINLQTCMYK